MEKFHSGRDKFRCQSPSGAKMCDLIFFYRFFFNVSHRFLMVLFILLHHFEERFRIDVLKKNQPTHTGHQKVENFNFSGVFTKVVRRTTPGHINQQC